MVLERQTIKRSGQICTYLKVSKIRNLINIVILKVDNKIYISYDDKHTMRN